MDCRIDRHLLEGYVDGELNFERTGKEQDIGGEVERDRTDLDWWATGAAARARGNNQENRDEQELLTHESISFKRDRKKNAGDEFLTTLRTPSYDWLLRMSPLSHNRSR